MHITAILVLRDRRLDYVADELGRRWAMIIPAAIVFVIALLIGPETKGKVLVAQLAAADD